MFTLLQGTDHGVLCITLEWAQTWFLIILPSVFLCDEHWVKKNLFCIDMLSKTQKHITALDETYSTNINQKKSDILWWHVLVIQRCSMKYWKQRYVGVDFDHCWPCLSSAALLPCQTRSKHTATCVSGQSFPQNSDLPCSAYLQQWWLLKIQHAAWTGLIYLLPCLMLCVTPEEELLVHSCWHWDTSSELWHQSMDQ